MPEQPNRHRASETRGSRSGSRQYRWGSLRGGAGVSIVAASAALGAVITIAHRAQPGRVLGVCIVVGTVIAALAVRPRAGRLIFPVPVLAYLIAALTAGIAYNRSTSKTELVLGSAQWIANGFLLMALATGLAIVLVTIRWILRRHDRRAPGSADEIARRPRGGQDEYATTGDRRDLPRSGGWSDPGSPGVPRQPGPQPGQRPSASDGPGQRNRPYPGQQYGQQHRQYPGQGYGQSPEQRPGQGYGQRPSQGNGQYPGPATEQHASQRPAQGYGQYFGPAAEQSPDQRSGPRPGPGYGQYPEQRFGQGYGQYSSQASGQPTDQRNGSGPDRRLWNLPRPAQRAVACTARASRRVPGLQLFQRRVAKHEVLDAVVAAEVDLSLGLIAVAVGGDHGAEPELIVGDQISRRQRRHRAVPR
jgi:Domain of unknown function (DUF6542)